MCWEDPQLEKNTDHTSIPRHYVTILLSFVIFSFRFANYFPLQLEHPNQGRELISARLRQLLGTRS